MTQHPKPVRHPKPILIPTWPPLDAYEARRCRAKMDMRACGPQLDDITPSLDPLGIITEPTDADT
jgi:hypothetical protein